MTASGHRDLILCRRIVLQARPYWLHIAGFFLLSLLASPLALLKPLPLQIAVDSAIGSHPLPRPFRAFLPGAGRSTQSSALFLAAGMLVAVPSVNQPPAVGGW